MDSKPTTNSENRYQRIVNVLLLNASFIDNLGLMHGKMGIAIYFFHLSRVTLNPVYEDYAGELIDEVYEEINTTTPLDFENGLVGIGCGIEYLIREKYLDADRDAVLEDIDNKVHEFLTHQSDKIGKNFIGCGIYYLMRLSNRDKDHEIPAIIFEKMNRENIIDEYLQLLVYSRYYEPDNHNLSTQELATILYFLDEALHLRICQAKIEKMLAYLPEFIEFSLLEEIGFIDRFAIAKLLNRIVGHVELSGLQKRYIDIAEKLEVIYENETEESMINQLSHISWYTIVFGIDFLEDEYVTTFIRRAYDIIDNESNWNKRLNMLNNINMGLNNGLAGLGFASTPYILNYEKEVAVSEDADVC